MKEKGIKGKDIKTALENAAIWCIINVEKS